MHSTIDMSVSDHGHRDSRASIAMMPFSDAAADVPDRIGGHPFGPSSSDGSHAGIGSVAAVLETSATSDLRRGLLLQIAFPTDVGQTCCFTNLVDWKEGEHLVVALPFERDEILAIRPRTRCVVRYVIQGRVIEFVTHFSKVELEPDRVAVLGYPEVIELCAVRRHRRFATNLPVVLSPTESAHLVRGTVRDLSRSGCNVEISARSPDLLAGSGVLAFVRFPGAIETQTCKAIVRNVDAGRRAGDTSEPMRVGLEFEWGPGEEVHSLLERFIEEKIRTVGTSDVLVY